MDRQENRKLFFFLLGTGGIQQLQLQIVLYVGQWSYDNVAH